MPFTTFSPGTVAKSADINGNFANAVHLTDSQKVTNKISVPLFATDNDQATITFDMGTNGGAVHKVVLAGNRTLAVSNVVAGQPFVVILNQDGNGNRTVTWWANILWPSGVAPTLSAGANKQDVFGFIYDGTNYLASIISQNL